MGGTKNHLWHGSGFQALEAAAKSESKRDSNPRNCTEYTDQFRFISYRLLRVSDAVRGVCAPTDGDDHGVIFSENQESRRFQKSMETLDSMDSHLFQFGWMIYLFWDRLWESFAGLGILAIE